jgi:hypothetical protein
MRCRIPLTQDTIADVKQRRTLRFLDRVFALVVKADMS